MEKSKNGIVIQFPKKKKYPITADNANFTIKSSEITLSEGLDALEMGNFSMDVDNEDTVVIAFDLKYKKDKE